MARRKVNLKKRLDELRDDPAPPIALQLHLDAELFQALKALAVHKHQPIEQYIEAILRKHTLDTEG